ncbi:TAF RNA polymerase I subunit A [Sesbania bispinosa]|nr:TAF RNA polymerase I subunit A [Sesbania bispinosa]
MDVEGSDIEAENNNGGATTKKSKHRKRKEYMHDDVGYVASREKLAKRILLSLTKPSYVLGLGPKPLRSEHRTRLRYLLRRLVKQHHWVEASGVLSAYLKGTLNDASPLRNRFKFWALLEILKHEENRSINPTRIKNLYDIWSKKIGSMKNWPVESRYAVHLEFMLFCLMQGNAGDAYQLALCLEQEKVDIDPVSKIMMGLTFYELWYSSIPIEFQWRHSDQFDMKENSHMEGTSFKNEVGQSEWHNTVESHMADSQYQGDSDSSVMNDRKISRDVGFDEDKGAYMEVDVNHRREKPHQNFQSEGFYMNSEEHEGMGDPFSNNGGLTQDTLYALGGLDLWLLPLRFSNENSFEEFMYMHRNQPNDYYKNAVKYLQLAVNSTPSTSAALLPLIQLLLIGGQVDEALTMLDKQCYNSSSVLPFRRL